MNEEVYLMVILRIFPGCRMCQTRGFVNRHERKVGDVRSSYPAGKEEVAMVSGSWYPF